MRNEIIESRGVEPHNQIFIKTTGEPAIVSTFRSWMEKWDDHLPTHWYPHSARHFWTSYLSGIGVEKELIQQLQAWSSGDLVDVYNDNTIKDKKWKSLDKLKVALANIKNDEDSDELFMD